MEELLQDIFKEATGPKLAALRKSCQDALGIYIIILKYFKYIHTQHIDWMCHQSLLGGKGANSTLRFKIEQY